MNDHYIALRRSISTRWQLGEKEYRTATFVGHRDAASEIVRIAEEFLGSLEGGLETRMGDGEDLLGTHAVVVHVVESSPLSRGDRTEQRMIVEERLSRLNSLVSNGAASPEIELTVEFGSIAQCITRVAAERGANLVLLSIERNKPVVAHLSPTITYSVAQQASSPVLTIAT